MQPLPIDAHHEEVLTALRDQPRLVLKAPTGSGKSTRVPPWLMTQVSGRILVLQPRRLAARMLARRVASEQGSPIGGAIGYQVRFDRQVGTDTRVIYCTEGVLLRMLVDDPTLADVGAVVFDEFHERNLFTDVSLARMLHVQQERRPDLKLVVMSATLDLPGLVERLAPCGEVETSGRSYPVEVEYLSARPRKTRGREPGVWDIAADAVRDVIEKEVVGDVLVFMPGAFEIRKTVEAIRRTCRGQALDIRALHGDLSPGEQDHVLDAAPQRRVIVSTNIAETSLTIDGVRVVVDSGLARQACFDPAHGINRLDVVPISQAAAEQRRGRAGRTAPGVCLRLWTEPEHKRRPEFELPEIQRLDLSEIVLGVLASGAEMLEELPWYEPPPPGSLAQAMGLLRELEAVDKEGHLTDLGRTLLRLPVHPRFARMLLEAGPRGCLREVALLAGLAQGRPLFTTHKPDHGLQSRWSSEWALEGVESDFERAVRAWSWAHRNRFDVETCRRMGVHAQAARDADRTRKQLLSACKRLGLEENEFPGASEEVVRCLLRGLSDRVAVRRDRGTLRCKLVGGRVAELARESLAVEADLLLAGEVRGIGRLDGQDRIIIPQAAALDRAWLEEAFPGEVVAGRSTRWDTTQRRVIGAEAVRFRDLVLEERESGQPDPDQAAELLADLVEEGTLMVKSWDAKIESWLARVNVVARALPEWGVPEIDAEDRRAILAQALYGLVSAKQVKNAAVGPVVRDWLSAQQRAAVEHAAPERFTLPGGRDVRLRYAPEEPPVLAATVQQLYGLEKPVDICEGRQRVRIEVLGPHRRPVAITDDLSTFWGESYQRVKKDLQGRYPKHDWR